MKNIKTGKIVLDRKMKAFRGTTNRVIDSFEDIKLEDLFSIRFKDEDIIKEYDVPYRKNIEVWEIEIIVQTK